MLDFKEDPHWHADCNLLGMNTGNPHSSQVGMDRKITTKSRKPLLIGGAVAAVGGLLAIVFFTDTSTSFTLDGQRIRTAEVSIGMYEDYIPLRANVEPEKTVYLDAIEGGRVEAILVEEGAFVEEGQPLIDLSNTSLQLDVIAREAEVSEQLNNLRNTQLAIEQNRLKLKGDLIEIDYQIIRLTRLVNRYEELEGSQFISRTDYENSNDELEYWKKRRVVTEESQAQDEVVRFAQIEQLNSSVSQLEKNLTLARGNLDNLLIRAPRAGQLTSMNAEIGESKSRGERLGQIDDVDRFKATALVNEFYLNRVRIGQQAQLEINGRDHLLEVSKIYPEVQASQFEVDLRFVGDAPADIRRGQTLQLRLVLGDSNERAVLLASGPFFNDTGGAWVFVLGPDRKTATRRPVQLGRRNPSMIEVDGGLVAGDEVIISSYANFIEVERLFIDQ
ncbi:MAG: HlyD family efflux transporter periplasmic adaptor subunit [Proteobacteria bacterium]|nr:HlyD family efflux transporter periplasmic adaptor subunit [Pseudomonadota bacterium]